MLNAETKRKIDSARDILVGKIPDPKAQVEQITTALIYKFMDDMDRSSEALGGNASFIMGELAAYQWGRLMGKEISGTERLYLYSEALLKFSQSERIPEIFRKIFKDAFLPYRDPEILNLFLKEIDWFDYDHSENLGDAFEYLLSILGSQGDAGQFRTPRQIIDFIVKVVKPSKTDKILDPACGTAGFLISAYKFILENERLTPQDKQQLMRNFSGYDISPDMVRLSLVNLYLHGFPEPKIQEYDTLTSEKLWNERFDVILANPPFMTPKGGIRPHSRFMVQAKRSEVLFVDYIAEHLSLHGRGGVIVPEGIIFQSAKAYQALRKMLIEDNFLWAVVSLPSGIFQPYSGVKTSILLFDRSVAKQQDSILFVKIANDGFDLGAQRREISQNDLPEALRVLECFQRGETVDHPLALAVSKAKIAETGDFNLTGERYKETIKHNTVYPMVKLGEYIETIVPPVKIKKENFELSGKYPVIDQSQNYIAARTNEENNLIYPEKPVVIFGDHTCVVKYIEEPFAQGADGIKILKSKDELLPKFLYFILQNKPIESDGYKRHFSKLKEFEIPLPLLEIQDAIVAEIEQWQKVIDGAKQVIAHYRPSISIDPNWEIVKLGDGDYFQIVDGDRGVNYPSKEEFETKGYCLFLNTSNVRKGDFDFSKCDFITKEKDEILRKGKLKREDVILTTRGTLGNNAYYSENIEFENMRINSGMVILRSNLDKVLPRFLLIFLNSPNFHNQVSNFMSGSAQPQLPIRILSEIEIHLPSLEEQNAIVAEIEKERAAVDACKQLITQFEAKIKAKIATVWDIDTERHRIETPQPSSPGAVIE